MGTYVITSPPLVEPITAAQLRAHGRIDNDSATETALLDGYEKAARRRVEGMTGLVCINTTFELWLDRFPRRGCNSKTGFIKILKGPVSSVGFVKYVNEAGVLTTLTENTHYVTDVKSTIARIAPAYMQSWPCERKQPFNSVVVQFVAGFGADASNVPPEVLQAIRLLAQGWYQNREAVTEENLMTLPLPLGVAGLIEPLRLR